MYFKTISDLQNVNITLRILFRPVPDQLPRIYTILGIDYDERVLPSITSEVLKAVVAQFDAGELITQREVCIFFLSAHFCGHRFRSGPRRAFDLNLPEINSWIQP